MRQGKIDNKNRMPEKWMLMNLEKYGNCLISKQKVDQAGGRKSLLKLFNDLGIKCEIHELIDHEATNGYCQRCFIINEIF